jgi:hypothetical protein
MLCRGLKIRLEMADRLEVMLRYELLRLVRGILSSSLIVTVRVPLL